ncbi:DUF4388 domain-containing protein, partial [Calditrichota bacterium]
NQSNNTIDLKIVLTTHQYLSNLSKDDIKTLFKQADTKSIIIYNVHNDATKKLAFYKLGAYRVFDNSYQLQDLVEFSVNIIKQSDNKVEKNDIYFRGNLADFSLSDLIYSFGRDKVSGILHLNNFYCSGKIVFNNGDIDDALSGFHQGDEAVLFMLTWNEGLFALNRLPIKSPKHKVHLSNIGLILCGESTRERFNEIVRKFGHPGVSVKIVNRGDLITQSTNSNYEEVIERLDNFTILQEILAFSNINVIELISWLYDLKKTNYLEIRDDSGIDVESLPAKDVYEPSSLVEQLLGAKEVAYLRENLKAEDISTGKLLILSTNSMTKTDFIHIFNQGSRTPVRTNNELDYTRVELDDYFSLNVFGISLDKDVNDTIEKLSEGLLGYIVLIDAQKPDHFEYALYMINNLCEHYAVPWVAALTNLTDGEQLFDQVKDALKIPGDREIIPCDVSQKDDVKKIILSIK